MKMVFTVMLCVTLTIGVVAPAQPSSPGITALVIIADSSWSCEQEVNDFRALARQPIAALKAGDYLEVIMARPGKPRLLLAQTIKTGKAEEIKNIDAALARIRSYFLTDASLPNALDMALRRLVDTCKRIEIEHVAIIILTDGRVSDIDARQILQLSEKATTRDWSLYLTGTKKTNRLILIAANKQALNWSVLSEANPELWLRQTRSSTESDLTQESKAQQQQRPQPADRLSGREALGLPLQTDKPPDTGSQPEDAEPARYQIRTTIDSSVSVGSPAERGGIEARPHQQAGHDANAPTRQPTARAQSKQPQKTSAPHQSWWKRMTTGIRKQRWLAILPFAVLGIGLLTTAGWGIAKAREWDRDTQGKVKSALPHESAILVLRHADRTYQLGPVNKVVKVGIGRHMDNAVRLMDESVQDHHLRLYRKGGTLMVQNLTRAAIKVNTVEVKPRGRHHVGLPATIQLNDKVTLSLELVKPKTRHRTQGSTSHEKSAEEALA